MERRGRRSKRLKQKTKINPRVVAWTLLISFVSLSALVVILVSHYRNQAEKAAEAAEFLKSANDGDTAFSEQKTVELPAIDEVGALAIVRAAFANEDPQALPRHFVLGGDTNPESALAALAGITGNEGEIKGYRWLGQKFVNGRAIGEVATQMGNGDKQTNRLAQLVIGADGKWRIDLDSYLRKSVPEWPEILSGKSQTSLIRIFIAPDTYYNGIYSDETKWQAYALVSPDAKDVLYGYAGRDSPQERALRKILSSEDKIHRATVEISAHPKAGQRQFEVSAVLAENWVIGETRYDESF